jgi:hypothetical protein
MNSQNVSAFRRELALAYTHLFNSDPDYAFAKARTTPEALAEKMVNGLMDGSANKDGKGIKSVCKTLDIPYTYKAIKNYLTIAA